MDDIFSRHQNVVRKPDVRELCFHLTANRLAQTTKHANRFEASLAAQSLASRRIWCGNGGPYVDESLDGINVNQSKMIYSDDQSNCTRSSTLHPHRRCDQMQHRASSSGHVLSVSGPAADPENGSSRLDATPYGFLKNPLDRHLGPTSQVVARIDGHRHGSESVLRFAGTEDSRSKPGAGQPPASPTRLHATSGSAKRLFCDVSVDEDAIDQSKKRQKITTDQRHTLAVGISLESSRTYKNKHGSIYIFGMNSVSRLLDGLRASFSLLSILNNLLPPLPMYCKRNNLVMLNTTCCSPIT
jgi:hypothetical protein